MEKIINERKREREKVIELVKEYAYKIPLHKATIVLIGSYARGDFNLWSDIDVLIISDEFKNLNPVERLKKLPIYEKFEIIPLTIEEIIKLTQRCSNLIKEILSYGITVRDDYQLINIIRSIYVNTCKD